jgi:hypothetical protein
MLIQFTDCEDLCAPLGNFKMYTQLGGGGQLEGHTKIPDSRSWGQNYFHDTT